MSDEERTPRHTPQPHDLFMSVWQQRMFAEGKARPGQNDWGSAQLLHWAKVWIDCCELAGRLEEMEAKAAHAANTEPAPWDPSAG